MRQFKNAREMILHMTLVNMYEFQNNIKSKTYKAEY